MLALDEEEGGGVGIIALVTVLVIVLTVVSIDYATVLWYGRVYCPPRNS